MTPYYEHGGITIYHGDCREIASSLERDMVIVSDPPYGMDWDTNSRRFTGGQNPEARGKQGRNDFSPVRGDRQPFDPLPWLAFKRAILWGANHYATRLPVGTTLVWVKKYDHQFGSFLSDAEIAWMGGGCGVYCFRDTSMLGLSSVRVHPTEKPENLMRWCLGFVHGDVLDPFMGSGTTLVAAKRLGRRAIGIEIDERYCEIAAKRLAQEVLPLELPA